MYNSILVRSLIRLWNVLSLGYEYSLLKKAIDPIVKSMHFIGRNSIFIRLFTSNRSLIEESMFYALFCKLIDLINRIMKALRSYTIKNGPTSIIYNIFNNIFKDINSMVKALFVFLFAFGLSIILNNIIRGYYFGRSYLVSIALIIISLTGIVNKLDIRDIFEGSYAFKFVESIFTIDEEVDRWW
ncbi:MAG: hypothetical protein GX069_04375 [Tissierellia bacterium]|nr:hypothetical protein [Tissierellia bacterium]